MAQASYDLGQADGLDAYVGTLDNAVRRNGAGERHIVVTLIDTVPARSGGKTQDGDSRPARVLIAITNEVLRAGIAALIRLHHGFVVSETSAGSATVVEEEALARRPNILLVDLEIASELHERLMGRRHGAVASIAIVTLIADQAPNMDVLRNLVQRGVTGFVTASDQAPQLSGALRAVSQGRRWLSPTIGGDLLNALLTRPHPDQTPDEAGTSEASLTQRERAVLTLVADGLTVSQIARRLHRSESAVKYHLSNMCARYQASNRAHLVYLAIRSGELSVSCRNGQAENNLNGSGHAAVNTLL